VTAWTRDRMMRHCGLCAREIPVGEVFQRIAFGSWKKYRCQACAGPAPPDLPAAIVRDEPPPINFARVGLLPLDWKQRQSRDAGQEG